jgi:hypothetical protein
VALNSDSETLIWAMFAVVPVAQLVSTVAVERATGRARERRQGISFSVAPRRGGGITLRLGMPLPHLGG